MSRDARAVLRPTRRCRKHLGPPTLSTLIHHIYPLAFYPGDTMDNLRIARVDNVTLDRLLPPSSSSGTPIPQRQTGALHLTPHHLIFSPSPQPSSSTSSATEDSDEVWISYPSITLLSRLPQTFAGKYPLQIRTRGFESYVLGFEKAMEGGAEDVWLSVKDCAVASKFIFVFICSGWVSS